MFWAPVGKARRMHQIQAKEDTKQRWQLFTSLTFGAVVALCGLAPGLAQEPNPGGASAADQQFVTQALTSGDKEIAEARGQLGSSDPSIRLFAQTIIRDHQKANAELMALAKQLGLTVPPENIAPTSPMPARAYMQNEVVDHQQAIGLFKGEANNGGSRQLRTAAAQTIPVLQNHLAMAQQFLQSGTVSPEPTPT